nr:hypothetical protein [Tanacetum cinerariifolium]
MSIQLADRSIKYPIGVCENLLIKINKFVFLVDCVVLEIDEDELVLMILGQPFLATDRAVIDAHEGKLSLRVGNETVAFNIGKTMKSKYSHDDYLYCTNYTAKLVQEQWIETVDHDEKWIEAEEGDSTMWILLLQKFDIEIRDNKGTENLAADNLSWLENPDLGKLTKAEIRDPFPKEQLMTISNKGTFYGMNHSYLSNVQSKSYDGVSMETRQFKSFDSVTAAHQQDIIVSPQLRGKSLKLDSLISSVMRADWFKIVMLVNESTTSLQGMRHPKSGNPGKSSGNTSENSCTIGTPQVASPPTYPQPFWMNTDDLLVINDQRMVLRQPILTDDDVKTAKLYGY